MTKDEALRMAIEALDLAQALLEKSSHHKKILATYTAIKEVLAQPEPDCKDTGVCVRSGLYVAQPEQEPLEYWNAVEGWVKIDEVRQHFETVSCGTIYKNAGEGRVPLYTAPPKREWVGLTDAEWSDLYEAHHDKYNLPKQQGSPDGMDYERAIEALLKERNHD